jgi:hypothetical protein
MPPVPRWRERALPQSTLGAPRLTFGIGVSAARVARPIKRQSAPHHKACDIVLALITGGDQAGELVACTRKTAHRGGPQAISSTGSQDDRIDRVDHPRRDNAAHSGASTPKILIATPATAIESPSSTRARPTIGLVTDSATVFRKRAVGCGAVSGK